MVKGLLQDLCEVNEIQVAFKEFKKIYSKMERSFKSFSNFKASVFGLS